MKRTKTGIQGLDKLIEGGIPQGYNILLSGSVGTLKSVMSMQFLINGYLQHKEKGMFITFEETRKNLIMQAKQFGVDLQSLIDKKGIVIESIPREDMLNESIILEKIKQALKRYKIKRLAFDSLDTYANNIIAFENEQKPLSDTLWIKRVIFSIIKKLQNFDTVTKLLIAEVDEKSDLLSRDGVSEFLCDGVLRMQYLTLGGSTSRRLIVRKMRSTHHDTDAHVVEFTKKGVAIN